jgi:hypothetical protein
MRLINERRWGDNPSPFYQRINWPVAIGLIIVLGVLNGLI